jgi:hypothetical protein
MMAEGLRDGAERVGKVRRSVTEMPLPSHADPLSPQGRGLG